jgi:hypothetical protein
MGRYRENVPIAALAGVYAILVAFTFQDYGITWDESYHVEYGDAILRWYRSGFSDRSVLNSGNLEYYGGFFDVLGQVIARLSPFGLYETRHLVNAAFAGLGGLAAWRIGVRLAGHRAGFLAALFLLATPVWYGHGFANPKDIPFAVLYLLALDAILATVPEFPRIPVRHCVWLGVTIGLTLAVRFGGVLLFGYLAVAFLAWLFWQWRTTRSWTLLPPAALVFAGRGLLVAAIAWVTMLPWWPAAQVQPLTHPFRALGALSRFQWNAPVFFGGQQIRAMDLPWTYLPTWVTLTLPEFVMVGVLAAGAAAVVNLIRRMRHTHKARAQDVSATAEAAATVTIQWGTLWFAAVSPFFIVVIRDSVVYDGLRHFLFVVPIFAITAAAGFDRLLDLGRPVRRIAAAWLVVAIGWTVADMVRLHPYQYVWFNYAVAGGFQKASRSYETDYWGAAYKEAAQWVSDAYSEDPLTGRIRVASCSQSTSTAHYLPRERFELVAWHDAPDLFLGSRRWNCVDRVDGRVVHIVERMAVPLVTVKETGRLDNR